MTARAGTARPRTASLSPWRCPTSPPSRRSSRAMLDPSAHSDGFARDNLPPRALWPDMDYAALPELAYPTRLNAAVELLDRMVERGFGDRPCIRWQGGVWSYAELLDKANRIANVLVGEIGLVPGNRVLLRAANNP